ncbi:hypothetical protein [Jejuia pallidilutea]|uniref:Beta-galactosidase n=1 Tax=Jejuia pallidilutea TaxID=504487 RepID=A0A090W6M8_9FLAO|nr:hypothetical protein [Jejuia pallidilutea]GAL65620.1 beta-galactosidase [Jejuia pallidilutea]GAL72675.1 beta-galactosidase [Jejuia pallidilutea]
MGFKGLGYFLITLCFFINNATAQRIETNFNNNWHFILKDDAAFSSEHFDDSTWEMLNVPHDWSFEKGVRDGGDQGQGGGYHDGGIGWYRKYFDVKKKVFLK